MILIAFSPPGLLADGKPYSSECTRITGISGGTGPMGTIRSRVIDIPIPRSRKAQSFHRAGFLIKASFVLLSLLVFYSAACGRKQNNYQAPAIRIDIACRRIAHDGFLPVCKSETEILPCKNITRWWRNTGRRDIKGEAIRCSQPHTRGNNCLAAKASVLNCYVSLPRSQQRK